MENLALSLASPLLPMTASQQDRQIADAVRQQRPRLLQFIRRRIPDEAEAEDLLQDVFAELVESYRVLKPVEQAAAWLFRVARNRIIDLYRRQRPVSLEAAFGAAEADPDGEGLLLADLLPAPDDSPENRLLPSCRPPSARCSCGTSWKTRASRRWKPKPACRSRP